MMKLKLQARHLWEAVEDGDVEFHDDRTALEAICSAVPPELVPTLATKPSAKAAWKAIRTMRVGDERVRKSTAQNLRTEYEQIAFRDGESIEDFALRLSNIVQRLAILGDLEPEAKVVAKYLRVARPRYRQLVVSIETLLDIDTLSVEEVTGRLKAATDDEPAPAQTIGGKLYLTEEEWEARRRRREAENQNSGASGSSGRRGRGRGRGGRGRGNDSGSSSSSGPGKVGKDQCRRCGGKGHWARDCPAKPKKEEAHVAQEEEASLLLVRSTPVVRISSSSLPLTDPPASHSAGSPAMGEGPSQARRATPAGSSGGFDEPESRALRFSSDGGAGSGQGGPRGSVHLREQKVLVHLGAEEEHEATSWVLDTGATNHMSGCRVAFAELDPAVCGTVRFGDDSVARIEGCGTVVFTCKNGEHRSFSGVYYIPRLTTNIVSVGQLDEVDYDIHVKSGVMRVREPDGRLLARVPRGANRLYVLDIDIARPACLATRGEENAWRWHARLGHINMPALRRMAREELVRGLPAIEQVDQLCEACIAGKQRRTPFLDQALWRA